MRVVDLARLRPRVARPRRLRLARFRFGLNTKLPPAEINGAELSELVNYLVRPGGRLETRPAISRYSSAAMSGPVAAIGRARIGATTYVLAADASHKLYYLDAALGPVLIGTLEGRPQIVSFNGVAIVMDGGYLKYLDNVSAIKLAYDDGDGAAGCQFDTTADPDEAAIALGDGTNARVAYRFTSQSWTAGYTIAPTTAKAKLSAAGTPPAAAVTAKLRRASDDAVLATAELVADASTLTATAEIFTADFTVTTPMSPATAYYLSIEYSGGDAANHVKVHCRQVASGGHAYVYGSSWSAVATRDPLAAVKPGRPPKASFGVVNDLRLHLVSPDRPGGVYLCNYTHLDWSTPGHAGWLGVIDDHATSFPVGAICPLYGKLLVYGTAEAPYICRLTGASFADFAWEMLFQRIWSTHRLLKNVISDLWSASSDGVDALTGVQEYGDLRARRESDPVEDRLRRYFDEDTAMAGYYGPDGQYWLVMPGYHRVLVARVAPPEPDRSGIRRYPWCEYELYREDFSDARYAWEASSTAGEHYLTAAGGGDPGIAEPDFVTADDVLVGRKTPGSLSSRTWGYGDNDSLGFSTLYYRDPDGSPADTAVVLRSVLVPTAMDDSADPLLLGGSDGHVYQVDAAAYKDVGAVCVNPRWRTGYVEMPFAEANVDGLQLLASSRYGIDMTVQVFINGYEHDPFYQWAMARPVSDALTLAEATMTLAEARFLLAAGDTVPWHQLNINLHSIMLRGCRMTVIGRPTYFDGVVVRYRPLQP